MKKPYPDMRDKEDNNFDRLLYRLFASIDWSSLYDNTDETGADSQPLPHKE